MSAPEVLQVITSTDRRGAEVFALALGDALTGLGFDVRTMALAPGRNAGLEVPTLGRRPLAVGTLRALRRAVRGASVVVAHGSTTLPACALALRGTGIPFVYRNIGDPTYWAASRARTMRVRWMLRRAAAVVAVAPGTAEILCTRFGVPPALVTTIPTGVSAASFPPIDPGARRKARATLGLAESTPLAVVVGALSPEKDVALAIDTIGTSDDLHLLVAGDGSERPALETRADRVAPGRVRFLGSLDDPGPAYGAADVVLLTSRTEAVPATLIEAGLLGLPVVTTDVGWVREIVIDGRTGIVVPGRDPVALAEAIVKARRQAATFGGEAHAHCVHRFELGTVASAWAAVLGRWAPQNSHSE